MSTATITTTRKVMNKFSRNSEIDEFLEQALRDSGYGGVDITTSPVGTRITLYVQRPGLVIGRRGVGIKDLTEKMEKKFALPNPQISVVEETAPELNPRIMASRIAQTVARGTAFRRAAIWTLNSIMNAGAMGAEIVISGKLRSERAHFEKYVGGVVPKSGDTADRMVRRATTDVLLKMGLYGVQVKIAIKDAVPSDIELKDTPAAAEAPSGESAEATEEQTAQQDSTPGSSRQTASSNKEEKTNETS
ncbi:MAG: 30S ribosomal protein S3 [Nitrososphaerales archaeon]